MSISQKQRNLQYFLRLPLRIVRYVAKPITRIFGPTVDEYPATGVQPFEGEPFNERKAGHESS